MQVAQQNTVNVIDFLQHKLNVFWNECEDEGSPLSDVKEMIEVLNPITVMKPVVQKLRTLVFKKRIIPNKEELADVVLEALDILE